MLSGSVVLVRKRVPSPLLVVCRHRRLRISTLVEETGDLIQKHPIPKFQVLYFSDLPPELIHHVMDLADIDGARLLGSTCRVLRDMSISYVYERRTICFQFNLDWKDQDGNEIPREETTTYLRSYAVEVQKRLSEDINFLLGRPDILRRIRTLNSHNAWDVQWLAQIGFEHRSNAHTLFFAPVWRGMEDVLAQTSHVTKLRLWGTSLTHKMVAAFSSMPPLHTLTLFTCTFPLETVSWVDTPVITSVKNATFMIREESRHSEVLYLLSRFLRTYACSLYWAARAIATFCSRQPHPSPVSIHPGPPTG
ncbi:hypothetical protein AcW1_008175 [Taiwanofungus camphoratus]|nr:hypothetical protein AcW1_008175 [Antrodia cinnamomea]KAI0955925.1 hypothetical protein AcV7_006462 [Antrodia cinnamomea]